MSAVPAKNKYGLTWMRLGLRPHTSSLSSIMATRESPQGNNDLHRNRITGSVHIRLEPEYYKNKQKTKTTTTTKNNNSTQSFLLIMAKNFIL